MFVTKNKVDNFLILYVTRYDLCYFFLTRAIKSAVLEFLS